jgi:hypothetical protein
MLLSAFFKSVVGLFVLAIGVFVWPTLMMFWFSTTNAYRNLDSTAQVGCVLLFASMEMAWMVALAVLVGNSCVDSLSPWCN